MRLQPSIPKPPFPGRAWLKKKMIFMAQFTDYIFYLLFWFTFTRQRFLGAAKRFAFGQDD